MKRRILNSTFAATHRRRASLASFRPFAPRLAPTGTAVASARALPLGTLWDHTLLDRLQLPLSRFRE
ncbi:MAG: hypothetical protein HYV96_04335 [Opitutae bacterium]|nr:hypothetical protein [Opitutae bacterium]